MTTPSSIEPSLKRVLCTAPLVSAHQLSLTHERGLASLRAPNDARIVDQNVDGAQFAHGEFDEAGASLWRTDIGERANTADSGRANGSADFVEAGLFPIVDEQNVFTAASGLSGHALSSLRRSCALRSLP